MPLSTTCHRATTLLCALFFTISAKAQSSPPFSYTTDPRDTLGRQLQAEQQRTIDPALGRVPYERLAEERERILSQQKSARMGTQSAIPGMTWQERGPSNAGGVTRAVLFDPNDPTRRKVWVGSPSGGLWYTNDITDANAAWTPVSDEWENAVVNCLAADPSNPQIMYAGTGNSYQSLFGSGIWKTTNGGTTWSRLSSTTPTNTYSPGSTAYSFGLIQRLVVNSSGHVYAATRFGVLRSTDGGATWQIVLAPTQAIGVNSPATGYFYDDFISDLDIGTDNILYAAFRPSRVFRATNTSGTTWTEITPPGLPAQSYRTEIALAASTTGTSQFIYAVSTGYSSVYNQDVKWFKKSADAGATWTSVTTPTHSSGAHFTNGSGENALSLTVDPTNPAILYAGGYDWFRSTDAGATWSNRLTTTDTYQHSLVIQPGNVNNTVVINDKGVNWAAGWGNAVSSAAPAFIDRNATYRIGNITSASMKAAPGSNYLLSKATVAGASTILNPGLSAGTAILSSAGDITGRTFIDENEPSIQLFSNYGGWYRYDGSSYTYLFGISGWLFSNPAAYDSQSNILYVSEQTNGTSNYSVRRVTNVGGVPGYTNFTTGEYTGGYPNYMKLGSNQASLFLGIANGVLVKYTNLAQTSPTATTIAASGVFPRYSVISSIDIGATDNELLVTLSDYGIAAVWYTSNGGATWVNKDPAGSGLPDVPVRSGLFNPQNRQQVILGTELGIWTTNDISAANPDWTLSSTGMGLLKVNQLRYRASDGRLIAATAGRGIFETNALAVAYTPSSLSITSVSNTTLCAGSTLAISFTTSGPAFAGSGNYEVWVSDAAGSFTTQRRIGRGTGSPVSATLPTGSTALPYGTGYRLKIVAVDAEVTSPVSDPLTIGNLSTVTITDRRTTSWYSVPVAEICSGDRVRLGAAAAGPNGVTTDPVDSYQWSLNGTAIGGATSLTYLAGQAGDYRLTVQQAGCSSQSSAYSVYVRNGVGTYVNSRFGDKPQCDEAPVLLVSSYAGDLASVQWTRNGVSITGGTSATYLASQSGNYAAQITSSGCSTYNNPLMVTLGRSLLASLKLPSGSDSLLCASTNTGVVGLRTEGILPPQIGSGGYSVVWYRNNVPTSQAQNQYYFGATQPGSYFYELQQGTCRTRSNAVFVRQSTDIQPSISTYGVARSACPGDTRTLNLFEFFSTIRWQKNGVDIPDATGTSYVASSTGSYTVRATKGSCTATSTPVSLTFNNVLIPEIHNQQDGSQSCANNFLDVRNYVKLAGTQVQWFKNDVPISGATGANLNTEETGLYSVSVTNGSCTGLSKPVQTNPYVGSRPVVFASSSAVCAGNSIRLSASQLQSTIQWKRNSTIIPDATTLSYFPIQSGSYSVYTSGYCGTYESDPVDIKVGEPTSAVISGGALVSSGQTAQLPVLFGGPAPWSFTLSDGQTVQNTYLNPYPLTVTPAATTTYSIAAIQNACGAGTSAGQAVVTVGSGQADLSLVAQVSSRTAKVGEVVSYSLLVTNAGPQDAGNVQISSQLPAGLEFVDAVTPGVSAANGVVSGTMTSIPIGYTGELTYRVRITQPGTFFTAAQIAATDTPDPDSQPNSGTGDGQDDATSVDLRTADAEGTLVTSANPNQVPLPRTQSSQPTVAPNTVELALSLTSGTLTPKSYDVISLSLTVSNRGGATATNMVLQTVLPAGWQLTTIAGLVVTGQTVNAYVPQLAADGKAVVVLSVQVGTLGNSQIQAQILDVAEPVSNARPGNGYQNGERDEAGLMVRVR